MLAAVHVLVMASVRPGGTTLQIQLIHEGAAYLDSARGVGRLPFNLVYLVFSAFSESASV